MRPLCDEEETTITVTNPQSAPAMLGAGSFESFYRVHRDGIYRPLAMSLRNASLAAEATDEAFARAFERWEAVRTYDNPAGWVYRVALNWARSRLRKRKFEVVGEWTDRAVPFDGFDPDLDRALAALTLEERTMVVLKHSAGWTYEEIAESMDLRVGTVKSRLHRAVVQLRAALEVQP